MAIWIAEWHDGEGWRFMGAFSSAAKANDHVANSLAKGLGDSRNDWSVNETTVDPSV